MHTHIHIPRSCLVLVPQTPVCDVLAAPLSFRPAPHRNPTTNIVLRGLSPHPPHPLPCLSYQGLNNDRVICSKYRSRFLQRGATANALPPKTGSEKRRGYAGRAHAGACGKIMYLQCILGSTLGATWSRSWRWGGWACASERAAGQAVLGGTLPVWVASVAALNLQRSGGEATNPHMREPISPAMMIEGQGIT